MESLPCQSKMCMQSWVSGWWGKNRWWHVASRYVGDDSGRKRERYEKRCGREAGWWGQQKRRDWWLNRLARTAEEAHGDECGDVTDEGGQARAYWEVKCWQRPTQQNGKVGPYGSNSISHGGAVGKEASHPAYQTKVSRRSDGVWTGRIWHGISAADRVSSDGW